MPLALSARTDRLLIRAGARSTRYVLVQLTAPAAEQRAEARPVNLALVLDRSGSMSGDRKFDLARQAVEQALRALRPIDRFALVVYDESIDVLTPSTPAGREAVSRALDSLAAIGPRGSTDLGGGWLRGCEQVAEFLDGGAIDRCLLLSDGLANRGITDPHTLAEHAGELRRRGVVTSTFGVGADFDERLMHNLAHEGGGNFYFIESAHDMPRIFSSELGEALEVTVRSAALQVALPPGADAEPLHRFRSRRVTGDNELHIELGDLVSNQELAVALRVTFAPGAEGEQATVRLAMPGDGLLDHRGEVELTWRYASHAVNDTQPRDRVVDREVAKLYAARARADATEANRHGRFDEARRCLERTAARIETYAADDAELVNTARGLFASVSQFGESAMSPMALKESYFAAAATRKARSLDGTARRGRRHE
jgi:Ca-activated chloride channel family protein